MQQVSDCGFFDWADNEMSTYERRIMQWLEDVEEQSQAEVRRLKKLIDIELAKYKAQVENMWQSKEELWTSRVQLNQFREKMYHAVLALIILLVLLYVSGYHGFNSHKYML
jgi:hypothetical protein